MRRITLLTLLILLLTGALIPQQVQAQSTSDSPNIVLLILDNSGSMQSNDPAGLRFTAARLFLSLLDEGTTAGVIIFSTSSHSLTSELITIDNYQDRHELIDKVQSVPANGYTDIQAAFTAANELLTAYQASRGVEIQPVAILLTDGQPEIQKPSASYMGDTLALIESLNMPVLSIALTRSAELSFLNQVAMKTGGSVIPADNAADLLDAYLQAFSQIKDRTVINLEGSQTPGQIPFELDPGLSPLVEQISFLLAWRDEEAATVRLISPDGQEIQASYLDPNVSSFIDPHFAVITIRQPAAGTWKMVTDGQGDFESRAIIYTRLRIHLDLPGVPNESGQPVSLRLKLFEEKQNGEIVLVVGEANFSAVVTRPDGSQERLDRFYDDGSHGDRQADDGEYTRLYVNTGLEGVYLIQVQGWKGAAPVFANGQVEMIRFPDLVLDEPKAKLYIIRNEPIRLQVHLESAQAYQLEQGNVIAHITAPSGKSFDIPLEQSDQIFQSTFLPDESGEYQLDFETQDITYLGIPYSRRIHASSQSKLIPVIRMQGEMVDLGRIELNQVQAGIPFSVQTTTTSYQSETVHVRLEGMPVMTLGEPGSFQVFPGMENELNFVLKPQVKLLPGVYNGSLVFASRQDLDVVNPSVLLRVEIYQAMLKTETAIIQPAIQACPNWSATLQVAVQADIANSETVHIRLESQEQDLEQAVVLNPDKVLVRPGQNQFSIDLSGQGAIPSGKYVARLILEAQSGLLIDPVGGIPLALEIPPVLSRCQKPLTLGLGTIFGIMLSGLALGSRIRARNKLPFVTGTLRHWSIRDVSQIHEIDLTGLKKSEIYIGQAESADISLPDPAMLPMHAAIKVQRNNDEVELILQPISQVQVGYRKLDESFPLKHKDIFQIGQQQIQYLSDHPLD